MRPILLALLLLLAPAASAAAQGWSFGRDPTGEAASAHVLTDGGAFLALSCTRPGFDAAAFAEATGSDAAPVPTRPGTVLLATSGAAFPRAAERAQAAGGAGPDLTVTVDGRAFAFGDMTFEPQSLGIYRPIPLAHPLVAALKAGSAAVVEVAGDPARLPLPLAGSSRSLSALEDFCP